MRGLQCGLLVTGECIDNMQRMRGWLWRKCDCSQLCGMHRMRSRCLQDESRKYRLCSVLRGLLYPRSWFNLHFCLQHLRGWLRRKRDHSECCGMYSMLCRRLQDGGG